MSFARSRLPTPSAQNLNASDAYELADQYQSRAADTNTERLLNTLQRSQGIFSDSFNQKVQAQAPEREARLNEAVITGGNQVRSTALSSEGSRLTGEAALLDALGRVDPAAARARSERSSGQFGSSTTPPGSRLTTRDVAQNIPTGFAGGGGNSGRSGGSSIGFGEGAAAPDGYTTNAWGQRSLYNAGRVADWRNRQDEVLGQAARRERDLSGIRIKEQEAIASANQNRNIATMNRQAEIDAKVREQEGARASESGRNQRESNERIAAMSAQSQVMGGLFGSIGQRQQSNFWN